MNNIHPIVQQYKPPESDVKFAFPPRTFHKSLLSSPSETSLALYSLEYCLLNLFSERERENELFTRLFGNDTLISWRKLNRTEVVLREWETKLVLSPTCCCEFSNCSRKFRQGIKIIGNTPWTFVKSEIRFLVEKNPKKPRFLTYHFLSLFVALTAICLVEVGDLHPCQACKIDFLLSATTNDVRDLRDDELWKEKAYCYLKL